MATQFRLADGVSVSNLDGVVEGYSVNQTDRGFHHFVLNVSIERFAEVVLSLAACVTQPGFLVIETGASRDVQEKLRESDTDPFYKDVFYLDNITFSRSRTLFEKYHRFFVHCGMTSFGFGSGKGTDEVLVGRYKIVDIYAEHPQKYIDVLQQLGITKCPALKTVWANFTKDSPGETRLITVNGRTIPDVVEELAQEGLYLAERREE